MLPSEPRGERFGLLFVQRQRTASGLFHAVTVESQRKRQRIHALRAAVLQPVRLTVVQRGVVLAGEIAEGRLGNQARVVERAESRLGPEEKLAHVGRPVGGARRNAKQQGLHRTVAQLDGTRPGAAVELVVRPPHREIEGHFPQPRPVGKERQLRLRKRFAGVLLAHRAAIGEEAPHQAVPRYRVGNRVDFVDAVLDADASRRWTRRQIEHVARDEEVEYRLIVFGDEIAQPEHVVALFRGGEVADEA